MCKILKPYIPIILLLFLPHSSYACGKNGQDICAAGSPWYDVNVVKLDISQPDGTNVTKSTLTIPDRLNLSIELEGTFDGKRQNGTIKLVEGRAMLMRGLTIQKGYEIDALDGPVLMFQMLVSLLTQAFPDGPDKLTGNNKIDHREDSRTIRIATPGASGYFHAPWSLNGTASRADGETVNFDLQFAYNQNDAPQTILLKGTWQKLVHPPQVDSSMRLSGWNLYMLGPIEIKQEGGTILDYTAKNEPLTLDTLGKLRESIIAVKKRSKD